MNRSIDVVCNEGCPALPPWARVRCGRCARTALAPDGQQVEVDGVRLPLCNDCWDSFEVWVRRGGAPDGFLRLDLGDA